MSPNPDAGSQYPSTSNANLKTSPVKWTRVAVGSLAAIAGVGLALNIGGVDGRLAHMVMRSPITIATTAIIRENFHPRLFELEQELLAQLSLAPFFLLYAIGLSFLLSAKTSRGLVMLPIAYGVVFAPQLLMSSGYFDSMGLRWYHMIPSAIYVFCYVPVTQMGMNVAISLRTARFVCLPRILLSVLMLAIAILCLAFVLPKSLQPPLLLIVLCVTTYATRKRTGMAANI